MVKKSARSAISKSKNKSKSKRVATSRTAEKGAKLQVRKEGFCAPKSHVVKRRGHKEKFDERKVYASVYASCLSAHLSEREAEKIAELVCVSICRWIGSKSMVTAHQLYAQIVQNLAKHDKNAAFMYETHRDVS